LTTALPLSKVVSWPYPQTLDLYGMVRHGKYSSFFVQRDKFYEIVTWGKFHKHFMRVTYSLSKISCTIFYYEDGPMQCFQNTPTYFATAVNYTRKMFMKLTPGQPAWHADEKK
jgi:hypothetical protein